MSEISDLVQIQMKVLRSLEDTFPESVIKAFEEGALCYFVREGKRMMPVIDFDYLMPVTMDEYKTLISKSYNEWVYYADPVNGWRI